MLTPPYPVEHSETAMVEVLLFLYREPTHLVQISRVAVMLEVKFPPEVCLNLGKFRGWISSYAETKLPSDIPPLD